MMINPFSQFFAAFEETELFGRHLNGFSGLGISASVALICLNKNAAKTPDLDPVVPRKSRGDLAEKQGYNLRGFAL